MLDFFVYLTLMRSECQTLQSSFRSSSRTFAYDDFQVEQPPAAAAYDTWFCHLFSFWVKTLNAGDMSAFFLKHTTKQAGKRSEPRRSDNSLARPRLLDYVCSSSGHIANCWSTTYSHAHFTPWPRHDPRPQPSSLGMRRISIYSVVYDKSEPTQNQHRTRQPVLDPTPRLAMQKTNPSER